MTTDLSVKDLKIQIRSHNVRNIFEFSSDLPFNTIVNGQVVTLNYCLTDDLILKVFVNGKSDTDTIVNDRGDILDDMFFEIVNIWVDDILLENWALTDILWFEPVYSPSQINYMIQNKIDMPKTQTDVSKFYNNGIIHIDLINFYFKYNRNILSILSNFNIWTLQSNFGFYETDVIHKLEKLLTDLK